MFVLVLMFIKSLESIEHALHELRVGTLVKVVAGPRRRPPLDI